MSRIFCIIGKSSTGKDCLFKQLLTAPPVPLKTVVSYTTRPIRSNECDGVEYHFTDIDGFERLRSEGRIIESRCYHTVHGDWYYFTVDDGQITSGEVDYLLIMTLEGFESLRNFYGADRVIPIYIEVEPGERLTRALEREKQQKEPKYAELCRRYLADEADFSDENIARLGITRRFINDDFDRCLSEICSAICSFSDK